MTSMIYAGAESQQTAHGMM